MVAAQRTLRMGDLLVTVCIEQQQDSHDPTPPSQQWIEVLDLQRMAMRILPMSSVAAGSAAQLGGASYRSTFFSRVLGIAPLAEVSMLFFLFILL